MTPVTAHVTNYREFGIGIIVNVPTVSVIVPVHNGVRSLHACLNALRGQDYAADAFEVIVVDDGIATGLTMKAALKTVKAEKPKKIILAVPVAPPGTVKELAKEVDDAVVLEKPMLFFAIGSFYEVFSQVSDEEVIKLMKNRKT